MNKYVVVLSMMFSINLVAQQPVNQPHTIGPVVVVSADYLFHNAIRFPDGVEKEFFHCDPVAGFHEGRTVTITFVGDGTSMQDCAKSVLVKTVHGSRKIE